MHGEKLRATSAQQALWRYRTASCSTAHEAPLWPLNCAPRSPCRPQYLLRVMQCDEGACAAAMPDDARDVALGPWLQMPAYLEDAFWAQR